MGRIKYATDHPVIKPWATRIGQLILNFAGLEFESYFWLVQMSAQPENISEFTQLTYASRINKILKYIKKLTFSDEWEKKATESWNNSFELAKLRNRIAHNPLLFAWADRHEETGEPDFIGIADMKARRPLEDPEGPLLSKTAISDAINQINYLVTHLALLRKEWCEIRDND